MQEHKNQLEAGEAGTLLLQAIASGLISLPHAISCLQGGKGATPWAAVLVGNACCPMRQSQHAGTLLIPLAPPHTNIPALVGCAAGVHIT